MMLSSREPARGPHPGAARDSTGSRGRAAGGTGASFLLAREPAQLTVADHEAIRGLAEDIPNLWRATTTTAAERKEVVRLLLERVEIAVAGTSENAEVVCCWAGRHSRHALVRIGALHHPALAACRVARARPHRMLGLRLPAIARALCADGWRSAHGKSFTEGSVRALLTRMGPVDEPQAAQRRRRPASGRAHGGGDRRAPEPA